MTTTRTTQVIKPGLGCMAWVKLRGDGTANVHVVRVGEPSVTILRVPVKGEMQSETKGGER